MGDDDTVFGVNLILLESEDFIDVDHVRLQGRRLQHIGSVHRASAGDELRIGVLNGKTGVGRVDFINEATLEMHVRLTGEPPPRLPLRLILALPRPKVLNRTIAAAASMGVSEIDLINAWRVEKAYWESPKLSEQNLRTQAILGLEQSADTILPAIRLHRLFTPFVREELPAAVQNAVAFVAHPAAGVEAPRGITSERQVVLAVGPEGGFIDREVQGFRDAGFAPISLGPRILRVETALAFLIGRLF